MLKTCSVFSQIWSSRIYRTESVKYPNKNKSVEKNKRTAFVYLAFLAVFFVLLEFLVWNLVHCVREWKSDTKYGTVLNSLFHHLFSFNNYFVFFCCFSDTSHTERSHHTTNTKTKKNKFFFDVNICFECWI